MDILCISKNCLIVRTTNPEDVIATYSMQWWVEVESLKDYKNDWCEVKPWIITFAKWQFLTSLLPINSDYIKKYWEGDNY